MKKFRSRGKVINGYSEWVFGTYPEANETFGQMVEDVPDSAGKEIYEGDIVDWEIVGGEYKGFNFPRGVVRMQKGAYGIMERNGEFIPFWSMHTNVKITVVGNIYDNPELMEE